MVAFKKLFKDVKNGQAKVISFFAKKARGSMAAFIIKNQLKNISDLKNFNELDYRFDTTRSTEKNLVFIR